eukprot:CAMPEP_0113697768 /NCGR_PEP_ID=MMETSP0038_2-20120614/22321_1 /TAXON_ID=2898 /ORGANISM="Cryptomonas paramecium" /LENGTH=118 /DNA_ID=CAMNT_0000620823 /DNA_START=248 /DNA_END=600 /DNA_ORIENTATION=- /assembly_acc=CAM_ASM_000170
MYTGDQAQAFGVDLSKANDGQIYDVVTLANPLKPKPKVAAPPRAVVLQFPTNFDVSTAPEDAVRAAGGISNLQTQISQLATALQSNTISLLRLRQQQGGLAKDWHAVKRRFAGLQAVA